MLDVAYAKLGFHLEDLSEVGLVRAELIGAGLVMRARRMLKGRAENPAQVSLSVG